MGLRIIPQVQTLIVFVPVAVTICKSHVGTITSIWLFLRDKDLYVFRTGRNQRGKARKVEQDY